MQLALEQRLAARVDRADDDAVGVEQVDDQRQPLPQTARALVEHLQGGLVAVQRGLRHGLCGDLAVQPRGSLPALRPGRALRPRQLRDAAARAEALERAHLAVARRAAVRQTPVSQLARVAARAAQYAPVQHDARAQTRAERQEQHDAAALARAPAPLGKRAGVGVVFQHRRGVQARLRKLRQRQPAPAGQVGRVAQLARRRVHRPARRDAHAEDGLTVRHALRQRAQALHRAELICGRGKCLARENANVAVPFDARHRGAFRAADVKSYINAH